MLLKFRNRITAIAGVIVLAAGIPLAFITNPVFATPESYSFCNPPSGTMGCINAWGGGPWVNLEVSPYWNYNDWFSLLSAGSGNVELDYTGPGSWAGNCVGDAYNNSGYADASLDECPSSGDAGWGTNMKAYSCSDGEGDYGYDLYDNHWGGYVGANFGNGNHIYLNVWSPTCWFEYAQD